MACRVYYPEKDEDYAECLYSERFQTLSVTAKQINQETRQNENLSCAFASVSNENWVVSYNLKPFFWNMKWIFDMSGLSRVAPESVDL